MATGSLNPPGEYTSPLGPTPGYPERPGTHYERKFSPAYPGLRGPLRFEEGVATDTDVPNDFNVGVMQGYVTPPGRINHNMKVTTKWADETVAQRAHVGSAAWVQAPTMLGEYVAGADTRNSERSYEQSVRDGGSYRRMSPAVVLD